MKNKAIYENFSVFNKNISLLYYSSKQTLPYYLHFHNEIEFLFFESPGLITLGNESIKVKKGSFITINRNEPHSIERGKYSCLIILDSFFDGTDFPKCTSFTKQIDNDSAFEEAFCNLNNEFSARKTCYDMQIKGIVYNLLTYLLRNYKSESSFASDISENKSYNTPTSKIIDYIEENYHSPLSTTGLAENFHIAVPYLCHIFKKHTGFTPIEYINNIRVLKSTKLLNDKEKSITEVSQSVGFNDSSYYARVFKKHMGVTPSEYRKYQ